MNYRRVVQGFLFLMIAPMIVVGQNQRAALLAVECEAVAGLCSKESLVRFRFENGVLVGKDLILTTDTSRVRYDLGENHIYRNRYVITNWGDIVDIQNKKLLHKGDGKYVAAEGDRIINYVSRTGSEGHFYYDLASKRYQRLHGPTKWALPGVLSPDQSKKGSRFGAARTAVGPPLS
jgi:hypothetical protein